MKNNKGFTLFELLVSISIIGILVAVATTSYGSAQKKARDARRTEDMNAIQKAAELFYSQNSYVYPTGSAQFTSVALGAVLQKWPADPKAAPYFQYLYTPNATFTTYCACAMVENSTLGNSTVSDCSLAFGNAGSYYCVKNQQ